MTKREVRETFGAEAIEQRPLEALVPYARNARTHSEAQVALIAESIREFGFNNPVLVDGANGITAGHGRVPAARKFGLATVPAIGLAHLTDAQKPTYFLADNGMDEKANWDRDLLSLELVDLDDLEIELADLGFASAEQDTLLNHGAANPREEKHQTSRSHQRRHAVTLRFYARKTHAPPRKHHPLDGAGHSHIVWRTGSDGVG